MIMTGRMGKVHVPRASRVHDFTLYLFAPFGAQRSCSARLADYRHLIN